MFSSVVYLDGDKEKVKDITRVGKVLITFANSDTFEGNYDNTPKGLVRHGQGKYTWKSGAIYDGMYSNGKREGKGLYHFSTGETYEGDWLDGVKAGTGIYKYSNGDEFHGTWVGDKRNGKGKFISKLDKTIVTGEWKNGHLLEETTKKEPLVEPKPEPVKEDPVKEEEPIQEKKAEVIAPVQSTEAVTELEQKGMVVIICGPPAAGKGTQCKKIVDGFGLVHLSTGDLLREAVANKTELGLKAEKVMKEGGLVPDEMVNGIIRERMTQADIKEKGVLLDGYPRTAEQAKEMEKMGIKVDACVLLEVPEEVVIDRAVGRRLDPETGAIYHLTYNPPPEEVKERLEHRKDDNKEAMEERLVRFKQNVVNLKEHYNENLCEVDGNKKPEEVWESVKEIFVKIEKQKSGVQDETPVEEPKKEETKKEEPVAIEEPKKEEVPVEEKKEESAPVEEPMKEEPPVEEVKEEPKAEKVAPVEEPKKEEPKKEESAPVEEPKKEEAPVEEKKEAPVEEPKVEEPVKEEAAPVEEKKEGATAVEEVKEEPKVEEKKAESAPVEEKKEAEPKVEEAEAAPVAETKTEDVAKTAEDTKE